MIRSLTIVGILSQAHRGQAFDQCPSVMDNTCLPSSMPICTFTNPQHYVQSLIIFISLTMFITSTVKTVSGTDPAGCCEACVNMGACVCWTFNRQQQSSCYLRGSFDGKTKVGRECTSGVIPGRVPPSPPPPPPPSPPAPAPPGELISFSSSGRVHFSNNWAPGAKNVLMIVVDGMTE